MTKPLVILQNNKKKISLTFAILLCVLGGYHVYKVLEVNPYLATDFGQWIMFSRYFLGKETPTYLDPLSAHPLASLLIASFTFIQGDSVSAVILTSSVLFFLFLLTLFIAVKELFNDSFIGLIGLFIIGYCQYLTIYMTIGLLPQLGALTGINIGIWSISRLSKNIESKIGWVLLGFTFIYIPFMHIPTAPIYIFTTSIFLFIVFKKHHSYRKEILNKIFFFCVLPLLFFVTYFYGFRDVIIEYATNPASFYRTGIMKFIDHITINIWFIALTFSSVICIFIIAFNTIKSKKLELNTGIIILVEFFGPLLFMVFAYLLKAGTDFGRFVFYFPTPTLLALLYIAVFNKTGLQLNFKSKSYFLSEILYLGYALLFLLIITSSFIFTQNFYLKLVKSLGLRYGYSLIEVSNWLHSILSNSTIYASSRPEGTWIEGLTGKATVFPEEVWYINRPGMIDRAYAGNLISLAIPLALENGIVYIRNQSSPLGIPYNPNIAIDHHGAYANLFTLQDNLIWIRVSDKADNEYQLNLEDNFQIESIEEISGEDEYEVKIFYFDSSDSVEVEKTISIKPGIGSVNIWLTIRTRSKLLQKITIQFADIYEPTEEELIQRTYVSRVELIPPDKVKIRRLDAIGKPIFCNVTLSIIPLSMDIPDTIVTDKPYVTVVFSPISENYWKGGIEISGITKKNTNEGIKISHINDVLKEFDIGYLLIRRADIYSTRVYMDARFPILFQNWNYYLFQVPKN